MLKKLLSIIFFCFLSMMVVAQQQERPKIGLALSGGGAKGLAHIGILQAIDSVGLDIDYVSGTSMGAIIGGLYAVGYSGKEIEKMARDVIWTRILSDKSSYQLLILPQKNNAGKYLEIPIIGGRLSFRRGALESNELWLTLNQLFFPYLTITDFNQFKRGFSCVAADIETGDPVILNHGNIVKAIRASMAIPIAFTPVEIDNRTLIDGGIAINFPVSEVKDLGADYVIGSSVSEPLKRSKEIHNPIEMVTQLASYSEKKDFFEQKEMTDLFIDYPIHKYSISSFSSANEILDIGIQRGREIYPQLKRLKDSLDALYPEKSSALIPPEENSVTKQVRNELFVNKFKTQGISAKETDFYLKLLGFHDNTSYTDELLSKRIRTVFGSQNFRKINYEVLPSSDNDSITMLIDFEKEPQNIIRTGLHYNSDIGIALKVGFSMFIPTHPFSKTSGEIAIGENPQFKIRNISFFSGSKTWYLESTIKGEYTDLAVLDNRLNKVGISHQSHFATEIKLNNLVISDLTVGFGTRFDHLRYKPRIKTLPRAEGKNNFFTTFADLHFNNLDFPVYPNKGNKIDLEVGVNYNQHPHYTYFAGLPEDEQDFPNFEKKPYLTINYFSEHYLPVSKHAVFIKIQSGIHFGNKQPLLNDFIVGGNNFILRNQILFPGFRANSIYSSSVISPKIGFQYNFHKKLLISASASYLKYDFIKSNIIFEQDNTKTSVFGMGLTGAYKSLIGPLEVSIMYNNINNKFSTVFNIGYSLNF